MRPNDQYFQPGDKVMRVWPRPEKGTMPRHPAGSPKMGIVYCVEDFWEGPQFNAVMLVGFGGWVYSPRGHKAGWRAIHFRKVEEIALCVQAVAKIGQAAPAPQELPHA